MKRRSPSRKILCFLASAGTAACLTFLSLTGRTQETPAAETSPTPQVTVPTTSPLEIAEIRVQGSENIDAVIQDLFKQGSYFQTKVGAEIDQDALGADIRRIYTDYGPFAGVETDVVTSDKGLIVTFVIKEHPRVKGDIELSGVKELSHKKLQKGFTLKEGERFSDYELWKTQQAILEAYRKDGYYFATALPKTAPVEGENQVRVRFDIVEGEKIKVSSVKFGGNSLVSDKDLKKAIKTRAGKRFNDEDFELDPALILDIYHKQGMLNAKVAEKTREVDATGKGMAVTYKIVEGPQFVFDGYEIEITDKNAQVSEERIRAELQMEKGDIFNKVTYQDDIARVEDIYRNRGNILADIRDNLLPDTSAETVKAVLSITEGSTIKIGGVRVEGLTKTKPYVIERELERVDIRPGEPMKAENLQKAQQNIIQLGPFVKGIQFLPTPTDEPEKNNLTVQVSENPRTGMFSVGGGYGSESGIFGVAEVGESNLFGRAYKLTVKGELGQRERRVGQIGFGTPWLFGTPTSFNLQLYSINRLRYLYGEEYVNRSDNSYQDFRQGIAATLGVPLSRDWRGSLTFRDENVEASYTPLTDTEDQFLIGARETRSLSAALTRDTKRFRPPPYTSLFDPIGGGEDSISFEHSGGALGGANAFRKYTLDSTRYFDTWRRFVLALHVRGGYLQDRSGIHPQYLFYERYWLGGIDTVRGFPDYSLLPAESSNIRLNGRDVTVVPSIGGNKMFYANLEYRVPINQMIRGLVFLDTGQVWNEGTTNIFRNLDPMLSVGAGVHLEIAAGFLIRLEWGIPLTSVPYYDPVTKSVQRRSFDPRFHFSMGPSF